ncbi:MAG TPA: hypothetical protein DDZ91_14505 [Firmicutes bacterium]|nr:hypothetical protein [Bacillota bacterium]
MVFITTEAPKTELNANLKEMSRGELTALRQQINELLAGMQENKLKAELSYHRYKGSGKAWVSKVDSDTKKILGFVDAESNVKTDTYRGYKVFLLPDEFYLFCSEGTKSRDSRRYVEISNGEEKSF